MVHWNPHPALNVCLVRNAAGHHGFFMRAILLTASGHRETDPELSTMGFSAMP
jgi:hypothetical protein